MPNLIAPLDCFSTALALLPPPSIQSRIKVLRSANDKSYPRWTAHLTLIFPFVQPSSLPETIANLRQALDEEKLQPFELSLEHVGRFQQLDRHTIYLAPSEQSAEATSRLWNVLADTTGYSGRSFIPHMTLGQTTHDPHSMQLLEDKGREFIKRGAPRWTVASVAVLKKDDDDGRMKVVDEIFVDASLQLGRTTIVPEALPSYHFDAHAHAWHASRMPAVAAHVVQDLTIFTFNILQDLDHPAHSRFARIKSILFNASADIVCLQEVTDQFLQLLLEDEDIRLTWTWCNRGLDTIMENERNIVVLTKEHLPFSWSRLVLGGRHKCAAIAVITISHPVKRQPTVIALAAIHLTAGLSQQDLKSKIQELGVVLTHLNKYYAYDEWIIAGDTNFPSSYAVENSIDDGLIDVWTALHGDNPSIYAATYDPSRNPLAAATARKDRTPQRYDRVLMKQSSEYEVQDAALSGVSSIAPASDHWALSVKLSIALPIRRNQPLPDIEHGETGGRDTKDPADAGVMAVAQAAGVIPSSEDKRRRQTAINYLCNALGALRDGGSPDLEAAAPGPLDQNAGSIRSPVQLIVVPVGSYAMGVDFPDSDLDCVVVGNLSPTTFWAFAKQRIHAQFNSTNHGTQIKLKRFVKDAAVHMMLLDFGGIKIDLQYCPAARLVERWSEVAQAPADSTLFSLSASTLRTLNAHRDRLRITKSVQNVLLFQLAHRSIKLFCVQHGIFAARFGYLGGIHISILLARIAEGSANYSAFDLIRMFFATYSTFEWASDIARLPGVDTSFKRKAREAMIILSPERPTINVAANASVHTVQTMKQEFFRANQRLSQGASWLELCSGGYSAANDFLVEFQRFVKIEVNYWGTNCMRGRALVGFIESRMVHLLVDLHSGDSDTHARLWPVRFVDSIDEQPTPSASLHAFYLIGLASGYSGRKQVLQLFEDNVHRNSDYYDPSTTFVSVIECESNSLGQNITTDRHTWSDGGIDGFNDPEDDADDGDDLLADVNSCDINTNLSDTQRKKQQRQARVKATPHVPAEKLRTSVDVYNRLMWDHNIDQSDYLIGYEDRFLGLRQMPLQSWKRDVEDEAFVPMHRVMHFMRKSDGKVVWDRQTKTDHVFGSGILAKSG